MPRQSFRHRFFTRNLASRERASFEGFARSQGLEREKVNHDLTRSPVVARSPRPSLPPSLPFHFPPRHDSRPFSLDRPVSFFCSGSSSKRRKRFDAIEKISLKRLRTEERTPDRERKFIPLRRQVATRIFLSIVLISTAVGYSVLCSDVLRFFVSPSSVCRFPLARYARGYSSYIERENLEARELVGTSVRRATHACSNFDSTWLASKISPFIFYSPTFFTRYRVQLLQNSRDRIKFNDRC